MALRDEITMCVVSLLQDFAKLTSGLIQDFVRARKYDKLVISLMF